MLKTWKFIAVFMVMLSMVAANIEANATFADSADDKNQLGMNTWFLTDYDGSFAFKDAAIHARPWFNKDWSKLLSPDKVDKYGWPLVDASTVIVAGTAKQLNGTYKLEFKGQADIRPIFGFPATISNKQYDRSTNTTTADVIYRLTSGSGYVGFYFTNTRRTAESSTNTGFSDVHLYRPGYSANDGKTFTDSFLKLMDKTKVIRMMDWTNANRNITVKWSDRRTPRHTANASSTLKVGNRVWDGKYEVSGEYYFSRGLPIEYQIELCNELDKDCWINIPAAANNSYVRNLALAIKYGTDGNKPYSSKQANPVYKPLKPGLKIYLEYGNEIWNFAGGFTCSDVVKALTEKLPKSHPLNAILPHNNIYHKMWRYPAHRMMSISDIFRNVYGDDKMMTTVRPLLMTQVGNGQGTLSEGLTWMDSYIKSKKPQKSVRDYIYGAGGAFYYTVDKMPGNKSNLDAFFATKNYPQKEVVKWIGQDAVWAQNFGLKRIAYEGGPSLDSFNEGEARAVNSDSRITDMIIKSHDAWSSQGGDLLVYYTAIGPSRWEFTPDVTMLSTPKLAALEKLKSRNRAKVTLGQSLPGNILASKSSDYMPMSPRSDADRSYIYEIPCDGSKAIANNPAGTWIALPGHADNSFDAKLAIRGIAESGATLNIWVNGESKGKITLPASPRNGQSSLSSSINLPVKKGLVVIRVEVVSGNLALHSIEVREK